MVAEASTLRRSRQARLLIGLRPALAGQFYFCHDPPDRIAQVCAYQRLRSISTVAMGRFIYSRHFKVLVLFFLSWNKQLENSLFPPMSAERPPTSFTPVGRSLQRSLALHRCNTSLQRLHSLASPAVNGLPRHSSRARPFSRTYSVHVPVDAASFLSTWLTTQWSHARYPGGPETPPSQLLRQRSDHQDRQHSTRAKSLQRQL